MNTDASPSLYPHMQMAVDAVPNSRHPTNKVAACLAGHDYTITRTNFWPHPIADVMGTDARIGSSSGTIHAETACLFKASYTHNTTLGASLFITDPPCPNCMKNIAESGVSKLYIDHKGFQKDFAKRRGESFENMSMRVADRAGIDVHVIYRKEQRFEVISHHAPGYKPAHEHPAVIKPCDDTPSALAKAKRHYGDEPFAFATATDASRQTLSILVDRHPTIGYTSENVEGKQGKYSFILQPINRLLMIAAREGLTIDPTSVYSSRVPTSREFVNMIGAGIQTMTIGDHKKSRDDQGITAFETLKSAGILNVE
jgi:deoxycytidylate deaminase